MQSVSAILGLVKVPQIVVQCFFVFALETLAVSPDESIEYVSPIIVTQKRDFMNLRNMPVAKSG